MSSRFTRAVLAVIVAAGLVTVAHGAQAAQAASTGTTACSKASTNGTVTRTIGLFRSYNLRVPEGISDSTPLLISLHGFQSFPFGQEFSSGWSQVADRKKFIVAYPAANWNSWNLGQNGGDVNFVTDVANAIAGKYCVDRSRIFLEGGSQGGYMSQRMLCDRTSTFAAASSHMGGRPEYFWDLFYNGECEPSRPAAVILTHGESDPLVGIHEGESTRDNWVERNGCDATPVVGTLPDGQLQSYTGCDAGSDVVWRTYTGLGHAYPTGTQLTEHQERVWSFLMAHPKP